MKSPDRDVLPRRAEFRAPLDVRLIFVALLLFVPALVVKAVLDGDAFYLLVTPLAVPIAFEVARGKLVVDLDQRRVVSVTAFRRIEVDFDDVEWIRVPAWGPVGLVLRSGLRGNSPWRRGEVVTALYSDNKHAVTLHKLASMLDVPVGSPWPAAQWTPPGYQRDEGINRFRPRSPERSRHG